MSIDTDFLDDKDVEIAFLKNRVDSELVVSEKLRKALEAVQISSNSWCERAIKAEAENVQKAKTLAFKEEEIVRLKKQLDAYQDVRETLKHVGASAGC